MLLTMPANKPFFTKSLFQTLTVIQRMASPEGAAVSDLARSLSLTRRSVFRLIRNIEHKFHIPVIMKRETFGGPATYRLPQHFIDGLSNIKTPPMSLAFDEAALAYLLAASDAMPAGENYGNASLLKNILLSL
jgi:hypothetical protein